MRRALMCAVVSLMAPFLLGGAAHAGSLGTASWGDCGTLLAKPQGGWWECTFADDFNGRSLDRTKWVPQTNMASGTTAARACYVDSPSNVAVARGELRLTVRKAQTPVVCRGAAAAYTAGSVSTYHRFSQQYGRFEARIKVASTQAPGLQEAFWLWPDDRVPSETLWPVAGEIDIVETYSLYPHLAVPFLHYTSNDNGGPRPGVNTAWDCAAERGVYNTYSLTWTPTTLTIDVNGKTCLVNTTGDAAFQKPYIVAFTSALGLGGNALTSATPIPATMSVDYLRVWR